MVADCCSSKGCYGYPKRSVTITCGSTLLLGFIPQAHLLLMSLNNMNKVLDTLLQTLLADTNLKDFQ